MRWLYKLGDMHFNWQTLTMTFMVARVKVKIKGDLGVSNASVSLKSMLKALKSQGEGAILELGSIAVQFMKGCQKTPDMILEVLREFAPIFEMPNCLPPSRSHDHTITLQPRTAPVSVRPYL